MGMVESLLSHDRGPDDPVTGLENSGTLGLDRQFKNGVSLSSRIIFDLARLLSQDESGSLGVFADVSVTIPLLAGSGRHIVTEPLTQAQRDVLYAIWRFERFKRTFAVIIASAVWRPGGLLGLFLVSRSGLFFALAGLTAVGFTVLFLRHLPSPFDDRPAQRAPDHRIMRPRPGNASVVLYQRRNNAAPTHKYLI